MEAPHATAELTQAVRGPSLKGLFGVSVETQCVPGVVAGVEERMWEESGRWSLKGISLAKDCG